MDGIVLVNKEKNMTSRDVVNIASKAFNTKKVGHTGTLDPLAEGVLVLAFGKYLKLVDSLTSFDKVYEATIKVGILTDTLDVSGNIIDKKDVAITNEQIDKALKKFIGEYNMEVPIYSAVKVNGKKLYEYARNNEDVILPKKRVYVYDLKRIGDIENNEFKIYCHVSKGTYIRSLIRDIGYEMNSLCTMKELNRVAQGKFKLEDCNSISDLKEKKVKIYDYNVLDIPKINVDDNLEKKISNGAKIKNIYKEDKVLFLKKDKLLAIYIKDINNPELLRAKRVFNT